MLAKKIRVIYGLPCVLNMSSKIFNNASNEDLSHYYKKPALSKGKVKKRKKLLLNDESIKNNVDVIILIP